MIEIGATATRNGLTDIQKGSISNWMLETHSVNTLHHGMCIGGDEQINNLALMRGWLTAGHPPTDTKLLSDCYVDIKFPPKDYLDRDWDIVVASAVLLVAPWQTYRPNSNRGSGTWTTFSYAEKLRKKAIIFWPDRIAWEECPFHLT